MDLDTYKKAQELDVRKLQLNKAITQLEKASFTRINVNGIITCDNKADTINLNSDDDQVFVTKSSDFFYKMRKDTISFLKQELELVENEFDAL